MKKILLIAVASLLLTHGSNAQTLKPLTVAMVDGTYAGTFMCSSGEMGMSLTLNDVGAVMEPGVNKRLISGILNFFPTVTNPDAPTGVFEVGGVADYENADLKYTAHVQLEMKPGKWLVKPEGFGASGLKAKVWLKNYTVIGTPTASGCYTMHLQKLRTN